MVCARRETDIWAGLFADNGQVRYIGACPAQPEAAGPDAASAGTTAAVAAAGTSAAGSGTPAPGANAADTGATEAAGVTPTPTPAPDGRRQASPSTQCFSVGPCSAFNLDALLAASVSGSAGTTSAASGAGAATTAPAGDAGTASPATTPAPSDGRRVPAARRQDFGTFGNSACKCCDQDAAPMQCFGQTTSDKIPSSLWASSASPVSCAAAAASVPSTTPPPANADAGPGT